jgi:putative phosphoesterase
LSVTRVAAVYDIHGNLPALEAVLDDIRRSDVERIVVGGDVLPGPMPRETLACLQRLDLPVEFIQGNGDREVLAWRSGDESGPIPEQYRDTMRWVARELQDEDEQFISSWPPAVRIPIRGLGEVLFCHATPRNDTECFTRLTADDVVERVFQSANAPLVVCGHTHMQFDRTTGRVRIVNAGSVGMPFGEPAAYWLLLGPDVRLMRTDYDLSKAAERISATNYPQARVFAVENVLQPPSEAQMLSVFSRAELKV